MSVAPITSTSGISSAMQAATSSAAAGKPASNVFAKLIQGANGQQLASDEQMEQLATGQAGSLQQVVLTAAKADLSFRLVLELRNKLMDSYQEIMRMQV